MQFVYKLHNLDIALTLVLNFSNNYIYFVTDTDMLMHYMEDDKNVGVNVDAATILAIRMGSRVGMEGALIKEWRSRHEMLLTVNESLLPLNTSRLL